VLVAGAQPAFSFKFQRKKVIAVKQGRWFSVENVLGSNSMRKTLFLLIVFVYVSVISSFD